MQSIPNDEEVITVATVPKEAKIETEHAVVHLTTCMTLQTGAKINVTCTSKISIETSPYSRVTVSALTPITLNAKPKTTISAALEAVFAYGWRKLPNELKLHTLSFSLTVIGSDVEYNIPHSYVMLIKHHPVGNDFVINGSDVEFDCPCAYYSLENILISHLAMGPEFAGLAHDIFYERSMFVFRSIASCQWATWLHQTRKMTYIVMRSGDTNKRVGCG